MKKLLLLIALVVGLTISGCIPTREEINEAKNARDGADRPVNERDSVDE